MSKIKNLAKTGLLVTALVVAADGLTDLTIDLLKKMKTEKK